MPESIRIERVPDFQLLKHKVYEAIKKGIINLSLPPNEQLVEQRLAEELGVSKSPIREALQRLEREGLVYTLPFKGCFVAAITQKDISEIFQLRQALETFCVKYACITFSEEELQKAREILSAAQDALLHDDVSRCYACNIQFHDFLISGSKNERITQAYSTLRDQLDRYRNIASRIFGRVAKSHKEHLLIMEALEQRDGAEAERRMSKHLQSLLEEFLQSRELQSFIRQADS